MIVEACRRYLPAGFHGLGWRLVDEHLGAARDARVGHRPEGGGEVRRARAQCATGLGELLLRERDRVARVRRVPADARRLVAAREWTAAERDSDRDEDGLGLALPADLDRETGGIADRHLVGQILDLEALEDNAADVDLALRDGRRGE